MNAISLGGGTLRRAALLREPTLRPAASAAGTVSPLRISESFLLRVGGLSLDQLDGLHSPELSAAVAASLALERTLAREAALLSDELYRAIAGAQGTPAVQNTLLTLRRAVHNRRPPTPEAAAVAAAWLPTAARESLEVWQATRLALERHDAAAERLMGDELSRVRRVLKRLAAVPAFRQGLAVVNPSFERTLDDYLRSDDAQVRRKLRVVERTLLLYVLRASCKTSPLSTLTMVNVGRFSADDGAPLLRLGEWRLHHAALPNRAVLSRATQAIRPHLARYPGLALGLQEGAVHAGGRVRYWKRVETPLSGNGPVHSAVQETAFSLHATASLDAVLDVLRRAGPCRAGALAAALTQRLGLAEADAFDYLQRLVDQGLLTIPSLRQSVFDAGGWSRFCDALEDARDDTLAATASRLRSIERQARCIAGADAAGRPPLMRRLNDAVGEVLAGLGGTPLLSQPALYEDTSPSPELACAGAGAWQPLLGQLDGVQRLLALFDPLLVSRATLGNLFKRRFGVGGRCPDLAAFSDYFQDVFYRAASRAGRDVSTSQAFGRGTLNPLRLPEVAEILDARQRLTAAVEAAYAAYDGHVSVELPEELLASLGARMPVWQRWLSNAFFVQKCGSGSDALLTLNRVYGGAGCTVGRFLHLWEGDAQAQIVERQRRNLQARQGADMLFAEFQGGHETNLNLHTLLTDAEIVLPGERRVAGPDRSIVLAELSLRHDPASDDVQLFCERLGKRIVPLYLGMLYPLVLPELQTLLLHFAPPGILRSDVFAGSTPQGTAIRRLPRLMCGQIVLQRARWWIPATCLPARAAGESDFRALRRIGAWREAAGVPSQVFVKPALAAAAHDDLHLGGYGFGRKPVYIDFDQPLCVALFEKLIAGAAAPLVLTERLPAGRDALVAPDGRAHTCEYVFELSQGTP